SELAGVHRPRDVRDVADAGSIQGHEGVGAEADRAREEGRDAVRGARVGRQARPPTRLPWGLDKGKRMRARGGAIMGGFALLLAASVAGEPKAPRGDFALGESVYNEICFACHGAAGDGKGPSWLNTMPRPQVFIDTNYMSRLTDQYVFEVVKYGKLAVLKREVKGSPLESLA